MFRNCHESVTDTTSLIPTESINLLSSYSHIYDMSVFSPYAPNEIFCSAILLTWSTRKCLLSSCRSPAYSLYQITVCTTNLSLHTPCTDYFCFRQPSPTWRPKYDPFIPYSPNGFDLLISTHFRAYSPSRNHSYRLHQTTSPLL
jgi:hypothetical protein